MEGLPLWTEKGSSRRPWKAMRGDLVVFSCWHLVICWVCLSQRPDVWLIPGDEWTVRETLAVKQAVSVVSLHWV